MKHCKKKPMGGTKGQGKGTVDNPTRNPVTPVAVPAPISEASRRRTARKP